MSDELEKFQKDPRPACSYGDKCYRKNPEHHKAYKHLTKVTKRGTKRRYQPKDFKHNTKKPKVDETEPSSSTDLTKEPSSSTNISNDVSMEKDRKHSATDKESNKTTKGTTLEAIIDNTLELAKKIGPIDEISFYDKDAEHSLFKECFLVEMPPDFFKLYECLKEDTENVEKLLASANLQLIGPYELLMGKLPKLSDKDLYLIHWRFFYDPPEFQAVMKKKGKSQVHIGYYRDDPKEQPVFLAKTDTEAGYRIKPIAENIFGALYFFLQEEKKTSPFVSIACLKLMEKVKKWAEASNYTIDKFDTVKRNRQIVCHTFHGAGIVVPYDKKTMLGYRSLAESDANLKKMFEQLKEAKSEEEKDKILSELQPVITYAMIAVDECDFGTALEAGIAFFCSGVKELEKTALHNFEVAYSLLQREAFLKIIQVHMKYRRQGPNMSVCGV